MKRNKQFAIALVLAVIAVIPALAQNSRIYRDGNGWVEEITGSLPATRSLRVTTDVGSIQVSGGNDSEIKFVIKKHSYSSSEEDARKTFQQFGVTAARRGDIAVVEGSWEEHRGRRFNVDFQLSVPRSLQMVKLNSDSGGINVSGLAGRLEAETGGGEVHLENVAVSMVETGGGNINVGNANGELTLKTGGGSIRVASTSAKVNAESGGGAVWIGNAAMAEIETGGGSIKVENCSGSSHVSTGGGAIDLGDVNGPATIETGGGSIHLSSAKGPVRVETGGGSLELWKLYNGVRAETGAGSITAELIGTPQAASSLETSAGDLIVYIASDIRLNVQAEIESAFGHKIYSDFPELKVTAEGGEYGPKTYTATGSLNGGGQTLRLETNIGNIYIRRAKR